MSAYGISSYVDVASSEKRPLITEQIAIKLFGKYLIFKYPF